MKSFLSIVLLFSCGAIFGRSAGEPMYGSDSSTEYEANMNTGDTSSTTGIYTPSYSGKAKQPSYSGSSYGSSNVDPISSSE